MKIAALKVYRVGGKYYSTVVEENGEICREGKQFIDGIPTDPDTFEGGYHPGPHLLPKSSLIETIAWKSLKINHFVEVDLRSLDPLVSNELAGEGSFETRTRQSPTGPSHVKWRYIIDLKTDLLRVVLVDYSCRTFNLQNIPRWLFQCPAGLSPGRCCIDHRKEIFIDPVPRAYLPASHVAAEPDPAALDHYQSCAPKVRPLQSFSGVETFTLRKHFRLALLTYLYN